MAPSCSFCKTPATEAEMMLEGPGHVWICSWCVECAMPQVAKYRMAHGWVRKVHPIETKAKA